MESHEYERKFRSMQQYLPYLEEKIDAIKKIKLRITFPDPERETKLKRLQVMYSILTNSQKKVNVKTLEKFESIIRKMIDQDEIDRQAHKSCSSKKDINPYHNPDIIRPGSSCSTASGSSISSNAHKSNRKVFDDTPASPSPPHSPPSHDSRSAPIIIPTERRPRYVPVADSPPRVSVSGRGRNYFGRSPSPEPQSAIPNVVPISKVDINQMQPGEWDTDEEDDRPAPINKRPEIVVPKPPDVAAAAKKLGETFPFKKEEFKPVPKRDMEKPPHIPHPSDNIPTVPVNALGGSRRLASVIEKTNLLNERSINRLLTSHRPISPPPGLNDDIIRSPSDHHMRQPPASVPFSPTMRDSTSSGPGMPSLLLSAPPTRAPVPLEDIVGLMDDNERNNLRRNDTAKQPSTVSSRPMPVPPSRLAMPNSSPVAMSPRSDGSTMSPLHTDPRLSGDPRSRPTNDPRSHNVNPRSHSIDPRNHNIDPRSHNSDPRSHPPMPSSDPRSHGNAVPRYADNYERHKRTIPVPEPPMPPNDYGRQRQMEQFGPDNPGMMTQPLHPVPNPVQGPVPGPAPNQNPMYNPHNQMGPMNYDYRMGPVSDSYGNVNVGPAMQSTQQQWNGPPHPHMQPGPPQAPHPFPMGPGMRGPESQGWQNSGPMYPEMQQPLMMNGDARMGGGYPGPMPPNMGRGNTSHIQPLMSTNTRYPNYQDTARPYDEFQRSRTWADTNNRDQGRPFGGRPNTSFNRPPAVNSWGGNKDGPRLNRDPRVTSGDRDPRNQHRPEQPNRSSTPTPKEPPLTKTIKGPPPGKEVHPNKLAKQVAAEKETASKKRPELHKLDSNKSKEKDKDKDKDKDKHKNRDKDKSKKKPGESMKSPLTDLYGTIDAKKAVTGIGLQKFKIPKKRPSADTRPEPQPVTEGNCEDDDRVSSASPGHESATKNQPESKTSKKQSKTKASDIIKEIVFNDSSDNDVENLSEIIDLQKRKKSKKIRNLSKTDLSVLVKSLMKKLKEKKGGGDSSSDDDDDYDCSDAKDDDNDVGNGKVSPAPSPTKSKLVQKKRRKAIIESSSDDSESESAPPPSSSSKKDKKRSDSKKSTSDVKNKDPEKTEKEKKNDKKSLKKKSNKITDDSESGKEKEDTLPEPSPATEKESVPAETPIVCTMTTTTTTTTTNAPVKPKPKRRFRELDMLQEDLKSSWICDGAMKATGSRTCSLKNKPQEPEHATDDEHSTSPAKGAARKLKKPAVPKSKAASKVKKATSESSLLASSDSDEDMPLARRSEGFGTDTSSTTSTSKSKKDTSPKATNRKSRAKSVPKVPPPLFDSSSNDSFNLDPSAVEPTTDISLHPETSGKGKNPKKSAKKTASADAESSSDESFVSNTSSLLPENSAKPRDNNAELLDDVIAELARKTGKKKQIKKKKSNWQNGIVSKKKKKKAVNRLDESTSHESAVDTSMANDTDATKEAETSENPDRPNDDDEVGFRLTSENASANVQDDEDLSKRVDAEALIAYTYNGNEKYQCLLCPFYRKNIVHHYKMSHPRKEVLISRLPVEGANLAIEESERLDFENNASPMDKDTGKYSCRFCTFTSKGIDSCARESFYEHCTNHTGEYRFSCLNCNYEAIAKGSIRTHYYKECRKLTPMKNFNEAVIECPIPDEDRIYGYLCGKCNFVQLKKSNVEQHVKRWHSKESDTVKIIKIDMSLNLKRDVDVKVKPEDLVDESIVPHNIALKNEKEAIAESETKEVNVKPAVTDESAAEIENEAENENEISVMMEATEHKPPKAEKTEKSSNLSAFVCPDELVDKDVEIQNERKKKMQEIAQNIGIKVDKEEGQKRLSITDQLKNKIATSLPAAEPELAISEKVEASEGEANGSIGPAEDVEDPLHIPEEGAETKPAEATVTEAPAEVLLPEKLKDDPEVSDVSEKEDKSSVKMKDPLEFVNEATKKDSDDETSYEETNVGPVQYDSDSSASQSDHEMATDVNSILQNTGEMHSPSKGQMMTTIQRLAAQLQQKPLDTPDLPEGEPESINADAPDVEVKVEKTSPKRPGDDMAILSPTKIKKEVKREPMSPPSQVRNEGARVDDNTQKPVIRIRRISGDKLSKGGEPELTSMATIERVQSNANEDDSGFLKIANVVSLAENETDNKMVTHIRKAMENSPQKNKGLSVLKKSNSFILKRVDNNETVKLIPITIAGNSRAVTKADNFISIGGQQAMAIKLDKGVAVPITMGTSGNAATTLVSSSNQPFKFLKIAAPEQVSVAIKLKSANVYEKMLKDDKLVHMFKCMGRDCCFTTSTEQAFHKHLRIHEDDAGNKGNNEQPKDYFKCAYCYIDCKSYDELMFHLKKQHIFCRYCCKYCFYRAFAYSYVEIHQKTFHQMKKVHILVVSEELVQMPPPSKRLERKQIIKPYVCVHECNKYFFIPEAFVLHLNMHHANIQSNFRCHLCLTTVPTVDNLIEHYKQHGYFKYHCMYCTHGSASMKELHSHLSSAHYNQPPHILERCLPREISKNMSAIDQLRVRDVDAIYRQRRGAFEDEHNGKVPIPALNRNPIQKPASPMTIIQQHPPLMTAKVITTKENNNPGGTFVPLTNLDGGVSNIRILDARSLSTSANTSLLNLGKNIKVTVTDPTNTTNKDKLSINNANIDDDNEFVSTNLLDHTELLSGKKTNQSTKANVAKADDYDSDIEIIEDYTDTTTNKETPPIKKADIKEEVADNSKTQDSDESSPSTETSESGTVDVKSSSKPNIPNNEGRFLKIEDVKGTGFEGKELFQCGVQACVFAADTAENLRLHMVQCSPNIDDGITEPTPLYCVHCGPSSKRFSKATFFIDHLKTHGLKRFSCAVCDAKFAVQGQAQSHVRAKHKYVNSKIVPADPMNPSTDGLFIVHPVKTSEKLKSKKHKSPEKNDPSKLAELEKTTYSPDEIEKLPLSAIFMRAAQCALCPYSNKVRTNVVRHLQAHLKDESVPDSSPVNPVPCLDKKERMFDKMVNLASSSHENGRMGSGGSANNSQKEPAKSEEDEGVPKYVPENKRFVCGVPECNYLTVDEPMLRHHLKALHSDELYFRCPHCPAPSPGQDIAQNIALEKMGIHLKMHDSRLYKCSHCIYHHYHRHLVERHMSDKHPDKRQFVKVIRELQTDQSVDEPQPEQQQQEEQQSTTASQESEDSATPDPDGNTWKCNLCDFKCVYKNAMQSHVINAHDEKCQFKCKACGFRTTTKINFDPHLLNKHPTNPNVEFITIFQRIKGLKKIESEPATPQDEPFDTTPLWRRDMPRIRHIRGILLEEEDETDTIRGKRKADDSSGKSAKIKSGKSDDTKSPDVKKARMSIDGTMKFADGNYGSYGKPDGNHYTCPICGVFKSKYKQDFRDHLFRDLKYFRWTCPKSDCAYKSVNRSSLSKHHYSRHGEEDFEPEPSSPNDDIEEWVAMVIKQQNDIMKGSVPPPTEEDAEESDCEELTIDVKEEDDNDISDNDDEKVSSEVLSTPVTCKHCQKTFAKWRGFKRHVQLKHLKRLTFLCPYCDRSTNSEAEILKHLRSQHKGMPEKVLENPNPQTSELSAEFWEREYGLVVPSQKKKRKKPEDSVNDSVREYACDKCDFIAMNNAGLKSHLKTHEVRVKQKCEYCTFSSFNPSEMRQHWEVNHPHLEFKVEEAIVMSTSSNSGNSNVRTAKKAKLDEEKKATVYYCYYCNMGSTSLDAIRSHWKMIHTNDSKSAIFKYKEHSEPRVKCAYCAEPGTKSILVNHIWQKHGNDKPVLLVERDENGWMCKWCKGEFFTTKEEIDSHQKMFHSHLPMNYKIKRRIFSCKQCTFETLYFDMMQKHAKNHLNSYKCKHCVSVFKTFAAVKSHFKIAHPDKEPETCTITTDDLNKEIETILSEAAVFSDVQLSPVKVSTSPVKTPPTSPRIAKKSTTKQSVVIPMQPFPNKIKAVARKSTNPLPRYPAGTVFETENLPNYVSYYGKPTVPVDLGSLNTMLAIGGLKMKVDCAKLAEMLNIEPTLKIKDFMKERGRDHR
ncbi:uncharacterized protein LOC100121415 isoform X2 [Nasonia vitripennis]|uniref:C2H2-type domain-containing protein n=1 Tax=Nasonia vitripennis TaxID=7425 RepID=A0A7M7IWV1_NASVI|nr:uncharacterized protein LOC100121415 isoform X2 [Nasonia vitripennis]